jgi:hypothetical protein
VLKLEKKSRPSALGSGGAAKMGVWELFYFASQNIGKKGHKRTLAPLRCHHENNEQGDQQES